MSYQLYQIFLFVTIYAVLGWAASVIMSSFNKKPSVKFCSGPYRLSFGLGATVIVIIMNFLEVTPLVALGVSLVVGTLGLMVTLTIVNSIKGPKAFPLKWYQIPLIAAGGVILVIHLHPLIYELSLVISPWIHLVFLSVFWLLCTSDYIDGFYERCKEKHN